MLFSAKKREVNSFEPYKPKIYPIPYCRELDKDKCYKIPKLSLCGPVCVTTAEDGRGTVRFGKESALYVYRASKTMYSIHTSHLPAVSVVTGSRIFRPYLVSGSYLQTTVPLKAYKAPWNGPSDIPIIVYV